MVEVVERYDQAEKIISEMYLTEDKNLAQLAYKKFWRDLIDDGFPAEEIISICLDGVHVPDTEPNHASTR